MSDVHRSRQMNPCDHLFWKSRGYPERPWNWQEVLEDIGYYDDDSDESSSNYSESDSDESWETDSDDDDEEHRDNSNKNNPNNDEYWRVRGWSERPDDWRDRLNGKLPEYKPKPQPPKQTQFQPPKQTHPEPPKQTQRGASPQKSNEWWKTGKNRI